jgi:RNA polymerase sigma-70 factor (ECF subfamily)
MDHTPVSLLERLGRPNDQAAWERFVQLYTPLLCHWARRLGLQGPEAADLVQDVFTLLVQKLPEFRYDPGKRFRAWLWTVTLNRCRERQRRQPAPVLSTDRDALARVAAPDEAEAAVEEEYRRYLTRRALELMQAEFQPATWKAFWECGQRAARRRSGPGTRPDRERRLPRQGPRAPPPPPGTGRAPGLSPTIVPAFPSFAKIP